MILAEIESRTNGSMNLAEGAGPDAAEAPEREVPLPDLRGLLSGAAPNREQYPAIAGSTSPIRDVVGDEGSTLEWRVAALEMLRGLGGRGGSSRRRSGTLGCTGRWPWVETEGREESGLRLVGA